MRFPFPTFGLFLALSLSTHAADATAPLALFANKDLSDWEYVTPDKAAKLADVCTPKADGVISVTGKPVGYLQTKSSHKNYQLHAEWRWTDKPGNGGVLLHISSGPIDRNTWPLSLQVQTKNKSVGDLLPMAGAKFAEPMPAATGAAAPLLPHHAADSEKPVGEWNSCDIICRDGMIEVSVNGVPQNKITHAEPSEGKVGFQLEGVPYELRNVTLRPML